MVVIFLDIDGVMNTERYIIEQYNANGGKKVHLDFNWDPIAMKNLKEILEITGAYLVISSTWRVSKEYFDKWTMGEMQTGPGYDHWNALVNNINSLGFGERILDVTPYFRSGIRGEEIKDWLSRNLVEAFVILDDGSDMEELTDKYLAQCDWRNGLTDDVKEKAIKILTNN